MKKILAILLLLLVVGCTKVTVLEVSVQQGTNQHRYKVMYKVDEFGEAKRVDIDYFYTLLGVHNFLTEVSDEDLSGWEKK